MDGTRCAAEPGCRWERSEAEGFCRGDGTRYQNPGQACRKLERPFDCVLESTGCSFTSDVEAPWRPRSFCSNDVAFALQACMSMPGCNWRGRSSYGGWCSGSGDGEGCAFETTQTSCTQHGCTWTVAA